MPNARISVKRAVREKVCTKTKDNKKIEIKTDTCNSIKKISKKYEEIEDGMRMKIENFYSRAIMGH